MPIAIGVHPAVLRALAELPRKVWFAADDFLGARRIEATGSKRSHENGSDP
jgi:hypothetical protein